MSGVSGNPVRVLQKKEPARGAAGNACGSNLRGKAALWREE